MDSREHKKRIILVHRWAGNPASDWYPWIKTELEKLGLEVIIPTMPNTETPVIDDWVNHLKQVVGIPDENTFFIGHSIGCQTILRYLETVDAKIGGVVFVAPWFHLENLESPEVAMIAKPWLETPIGFEKIKNNCKNITAFLSGNEPFGCVAENKEILENKLSAQVTILENKGHFTEDDGCRELPELVTEILNIIHPPTNNQSKNIAYIDGQNLYMGTMKSAPFWEIDLARFRIYLEKKYHVTKAYYYLGYLMDDNQDLYEQIQSAGFVVVFREHNSQMLGKKKGNVDSGIIFSAMKKLYHNEDFDKIVLVSGDGDYKMLVDFLIAENKFEKILFPNRKFRSSLYKELSNKHFVYLNDQDIKEKIAKEKFRQKEKGALGS